MSSGFRIDFSPQTTDNYDGGSQILDRLMGKVGAAFKKIERAIGLPNGIAPLDENGLIPAEFLANGIALTPSDQYVFATAAANTATTATLPAVGGKSHYITSIQLSRVATAAVAGGARLVTNSTNLPGTAAWCAGNAIAAGQTILDLSYQPTTPLKSMAPGVATTITMPAAGVAVFNQINISYFVA